VGGTLQQDRIKSLLRANDEAKPQCSTKSIVLGKAKVVSFEDHVEARNKRAEKEASKLTKKKRACGQKPKDSTLEVHTPGLVGEVAYIRETLGLAGLPDMQGFLTPRVGRAPVAQMY
jgi:hypothetical protein